MARDPYIEQRLLSWGRWRRGDRAGGLGFSTTAWSAFAAGGVRGGTAAAVTPDGEEALTDRAVLSLVDEHQAALVQQYVEDGTRLAKAGRLGCHERTFIARLDAGHRGVSRWLAERQVMLEAERARVEALQRGTSSGLAARLAVVDAERDRTDALLGIRRRRRKARP